MPAFGLYADRGVLAFGVRARAGVLRDGPAPSGHLEDPGLGGLATGGIAMRASYHGGWAEVVGGAGLTGHDFVPAFEGGVGWDFQSGAFDFGPSARLVHVVGDSSMDRLGSADLLLVGLDVQFGKARPHPVVARVEPLPPPPPPPEVVATESDGDRMLDEDDSCERDPDGCPLGSIEVIDDRIVLDERVLFDTDRAHVKSRGREMIAQIAALWREHPEWTSMTIEGHADVRGTDEYNLDLSQRRADHVRDVLVRLGFTTEQMTAVGYGRTRPRDPGTTAEAHQRNRRVEFVIERGGKP